MEVQFQTTFESQIEILPRIFVDYSEELNEMGGHYAIEISWLWFALLIVFVKDV